MNWKFAEVSPGSWTNSGVLFASTTDNYGVDTSGSKFFFVDNNPTQVQQTNEDPTKYLETIDNENIRIFTFRPDDLIKKTTYDIKLEIQSQAVYDRIKYLWTNGLAFNLYNNQNIGNPTVTNLWLSMDDLTVDWVAIKGGFQIYNISLKCTDLSTDSSGNPIKLRFEEPDSDDKWIGTYLDTETISTFISFLSSFAPTSLDESFKKRGNDVETINGTIVRVVPIRIRSDNSIEKLPLIKMLSIKLEYQDPDVYTNIKQLYDLQEKFRLYGNSAVRDAIDAPSGSNYGVYIMDDFSVEYVAVRGNSRLYTLTLSLREADNT